VRNGSAKSKLPRRGSGRAVEGLTAQQLDTPYRPDGWTSRQVVHHVADSHLHSYIRFRLALTEDQPTIKPYDQAKWAELPDARTAPVEVSLQLIDSLHQRWAVLLRSMSDAISPVLSSIPSAASWSWIPPWPCTPGIAATIGRTSPGCGNGWAGNNSYNQTTRGSVQCGAGGYRLPGYNGLGPQEFPTPMNSRIKYLIVSASSCLAVLLLIGSVLGQGASPTDDPYKHIGVFSDVVSRIKTEYVEEPDMKSVTMAL